MLNWLLGFGLHYLARPLTAQEKKILRPYFANIVLEKARIVENRVPFWLLRAMCAVVLGNTIYFREGAYVPNTKRGIELLAHELTHVSQGLHGMNVWRYVWSCRHGYVQSAYEIEAYAKGRMVAADFVATNFTA